MPFRHPQTQLEILLCDHLDGIAGQNHRPDRHGPLQHPPVDGSQNLPFIELLLDDRSLGGPRAQTVFGDVERGPRLVELGPRQDAAVDQPLGSMKSICAWSDWACKRIDLRIQRLHLQGELFVGDHGDGLSARDAVAFPDIELRRLCRRCGRAPARR